MSVKLGGVMRHHYKASHEISRTNKTQAEHIQALSSGTRLHSAADDAARLARASGEANRVRSNNQAKKNAQDALSLVSTSSNSMVQIQNVLSRMRELAVQASNEGTMQDGQRAYLQNEISSMVGALNTIVGQTTYGSTSLLDQPPEQLPVPYIDDFLTQGVMSNHSSGLNSFGIIPVGTENLTLTLNSYGMDDDLQITARNGRHLVGTPLTDGTWTSNSVNAGSIDSLLITKSNGYLDGASYDDSGLHSPAYNFGSPSTVSYNGMNIGNSGEGQTASPASNFEKVTIDKATEDLIITITGTGSFEITPTWTSIPASADRTAGLEPKTFSFQIGTDNSDFDIMKVEAMDLRASALGLSSLDLSSASGALEAMTTLDSAMATVEGHQAKYGRYENTLERAMQQSETRKVQAETNLGVSQSTDIAETTAEMARSQINAETLSSGLKSADYLKELYVNLIQGGM